MNTSNFIKSLKINDFEKFICETCAEIKFEENSVYIRLLAYDKEKCPEFYVDDFSFKGINDYSSYSLTTAWRKFLHEMFGNEYYNALYEHLNSTNNNTSTTLNP